MTNTLYYRYIDANTVRDWYYNARGDRVDVGTYRIGPNWRRWRDGDIPLCITFADGGQIVFDRLEEVK